ncbi:MAG: FRG domain-containing protein [Planctomycetota bacterium]|jgi:hypothetical protein
MEKYGKLTYSHFSDFENKDYNNGVLTLNLTSWGEFNNVVQIFNDKTDYIWRGQRCYREDWKLKSTFDRKFKKFPSEEERKIKHDEILEKFKQRLVDLPDKRSNSFSDDEIWAIGQHYGLPTPLLDWTECPYIAAYMAFFKKDTNDQTENRVLYALNRALKLLILKRKNAKTKELLSRERFVKFPELRDNLDEMQNERLKRQKGKFTKSLNGEDIKINVEKLSNKGKYNQKIILAEILIPNKVRDECMAFLESKKITHGALFPDFAGAVEICKIELGID